MPAIAAVRGTHDLLPSQSHAWRRLHELHEQVAASFGYRLADSPVFEHTELFERGVGSGTDVVDKEMYTFTDRGERSLTLRPEGTAGMVRALLGGAVLQEQRPARVHYAGPMFRYDKPQALRYRQFHQVGVECLGERSPHLDVEVVEMCVRFLEALGLRGISIQVNSLGDLEDRSRFREALVAYYEPLAARLCDDCRRRLRVNPLRLLDCKRDAGLAADAPRLADLLGAESAVYFAAVERGLEAAGIDAVRNHRLVRGLDYYAHTTFEVWHTSLQGAQNALGGGGRYDGLAEVLGFPPTPGVGYAMGVERLLALAETEGVAPAPPRVAEAVVLPLGAEQADAAAGVARHLRGAGLLVILDASERKLGPRLAAAEKLGAAAAVILGPDEVAAGAAAVRDMRSREQVTVALEDLAGRVRTALTTEPADEH